MFLDFLESVAQAIAYKNGNKNAARAVVKDTDEVATGIDLSLTGDVGLETSILFKNGSIIEVRPTADKPIRSNRHKQPN